MRGKWTMSRKWKPVNEAAGPWLIRSHYHGAWHRRSSTGGACGYTDDITQAGVFDYAKAREYHDEPPSRRDEAIPAAKVIKELEAALVQKARELGDLAATVARVRAALSLAHPQPKGEEA